MSADTDFMPAAARKKARRPEPSPAIAERRQQVVKVYREVGSIFWFGLALLTLLSLISYDPQDYSWHTSHPNETTNNFIGPLGAVLSWGLFFVIGMGAYMTPLLFGIAGLALFLNMELAWLRKIFWTTIFLFSIACLIDLATDKLGETVALWTSEKNLISPGGFGGASLNEYVFEALLGQVGSAIVLGMIYFISLLLLIETHPIQAFRNYMEEAQKRRERLEELRYIDDPEGALERRRQKLLQEQAQLEKQLRKQGVEVPPLEPAHIPEPEVYLPADEPEPEPQPAEIIDALDANTTRPRQGNALSSSEADGSRPDPSRRRKRPRAGSPTDCEADPEESLKLEGAADGPYAEEEFDPAAGAETAKKAQTAARATEIAGGAKTVKTIAGPSQAAELIDVENYQIPPQHLLAETKLDERPVLNRDELETKLALLLRTLKQFGISCTPGPITRGATITRFEIFPAEGVRVGKIVNLQKDLSRALKAEKLNILAPIPGKDSVGVEIANKNKVPIVLRDLFEDEDWISTDAKIPLALGKDVYGKTLVADLAGMPHMLIAGTTGSGKSVCINCIILSILYRFKPDEMRLILVDPKQVEMQVYNSLPHLVVPVVTDPKKVLLALRWVINEMEERYKILAKTGVRNIASYNKKMAKKKAEREAALEAARQRKLDLDADGDEDEEVVEQVEEVSVPRDDDVHLPDKLPYIVVIIDELADLMQTAPADVEAAIARITAKARAAGIHLIVATQTPRREVITGVIKTNILCRIAFQVPSALDSRVILDSNGAENLLGKGDMLFMPPDSPRLTRGQGAFVSDDEVQAVSEYCGEQSDSVFEATIHSKMTGESSELDGIDEKDAALLRECMNVIRQEKRASTSMLQRRLRLGYNRAAWVIDQLESMGVVGPENGAKPREIMVDLDTYTLPIE